MRTDDLLDLLDVPLKSNSIVFLEQLHARDHTSIDRLCVFILKYQQKNIAIHIHLDGLLDTLKRQMELSSNIEQTLDDFLDNNSIDYKSITRELYAVKWRGLIAQAHEQGLSYHTIFHSVEVAARVILGAKHIGLFLSGDERRSFFLRFLLLNAAKYHDFKQRKRGIPVSSEYATAEEETAADVSKWLIRYLELSDESSLGQFIILFFKHAIVNGTTPLFGKDELINLSTLYYELEDCVSASIVTSHESNISVTHEMKAMAEVMSIMDKVPAACSLVAENQRVTSETNTQDWLKYYLNRELLLVDFFTSQPERYYPDSSFADNIEAKNIFEVAHTGMRFELNGEMPEAQLLRHFVEAGQTIHRTAQDQEKFAHLLSQVHMGSPIKNAVTKVYFDKLDEEINFVKRLPQICHDAITKLQALHYLNEAGQSVYAMTPKSLKSSSQSNDSITSMYASSMKIVNPRKLQPTEILPFIDPRVPECEVMILRKTAIYYKQLNEFQQTQVAQEILVSSICQPGVAYVKHPHLIMDAIEPKTPLNCETPEHQRDSPNKEERTCARSFVHSRHSFVAQPKRSLSLSRRAFETQYDDIDNEIACAIRDVQLKTDYKG